MMSSEPSQARRDPVFRYTFRIQPEVIDENGHVNNVHYVQWMQDSAVRHFEALGGIPLIREIGATWVVRSHTIEYLSPVFAGEEIEAQTWVVNLHRVRSLRRYKFVRKSDDRLVVKGETEWVLVDVNTGRPVAIPENVAKIFPLLSNE
jgi:acyl-CoA thioester hydrolase